MKRTLLLLPAILIAITMLIPAQALAEEDAVLIRVESVEGVSGEQIDVPVMLENCAGVDSIQMDINYDSAALQVVSMTPGDLFPAQYTVANLEEPNRVRIACASALGIEGAGTLLTLRFRVLTETGSALSVTSGIVTRVDADFNQTKAYVAVENGGVTVDGAPLPEAAVTPWIPETPAPTPSPTPVPTPTQSVTPEPASVSTLPDTVSTVVSGIPVTAYYVAGGLALILIVLVVVLASRRKRGGR